MHDLIDPPRVDPDVLCQAVLADPHLLKELLQKDLARMNRRKLLRAHPFLLSMIVNDLHLVRVHFPPDEADTPSIVDPNSVMDPLGDLLVAVNRLPHYSRSGELGDWVR